MGKPKTNSSFRMSGKLFAATLGLFALTLSTSIAATYAWYSVRDFARIDRITMNLNDSSELSIGLKDETGHINYKQDISQEDLMAADPNYTRDSSLKDVSSMFASSWLDQDIDPDLKTPILRAPYMQSEGTTMTEQATSGYLQFEVFFKANVACHLYLGEDTKATVLERWNHAIAAQTDYDEEELNRVLDCARVSFYSKEGYHIIELGQDEVSHTKFAGPLQAKSLDGYYDYVDDKETMYGEFIGEPQYLEALDEDLAEYEDDSAFHAIHKAGVQRVDATSVAPVMEQTHLLDEFIFHNTSSGRGVIPLGTLHPSEDYRLVISVYLEGWDLDLTDALATGKFSLDLSFVGLMDI